MTKMLIRSGISPLETFTAPEIFDRNAIGGNVGNLIYAYSVYRTLTNEDTTITPDYYRINHNDADEINEKYDYYIIPLADAFRESFRPALRRYTKLIKKLKIPVVVIGVGLRAPFEPQLDEGFSFDQDVKEFVKAVLEKSSMIGLRGEITSKYLSRLGFREGVDHKVIGCPSMYTFGREIKIRDTDITKDSMICVNSSRLSPDSVLNFISRGMEEYPNYYFIPQWLSEMRLTYTGISPFQKIYDNYPDQMSDPAYMNDRVRFFLNAPTWIDFMKQADLSFGARLHGNITATIAGTPSILIPKDARMRELTRYHNLTHIWYNDLTENMTLSEVIEQVDFKSPEKVQQENFDNFVDFLNQNNLPHIYKDDINRADAPIDDQVKNTPHLPPVTTISGCSLEEMVERWENHFPVEVSKENRIQHREKQKIKNKYKKELAKKNKRIKWLEGTLNRKSARFALNIANKLRLK